MLQNTKSVLQKTKKTNNIELVFIVNCTLFVTLYRTDTATDNHPDQSQSSRKRCPDPEDGGSVCVPSHWHQLATPLPSQPHAWQSLGSKPCKYSQASRSGFY